MQKKSPRIPVIDIFAGPGGIGEGFSNFQTRQERPFEIVLSIEKEKYANQTLKLRSFYRQFPNDQIPIEYYQFLRNEITETELYDLFPMESKRASSQAWMAELGVNDPSEIDKRIDHALRKSREWVLIGGPPCQAYSVIGRSRYSRIWREQPNKRDEDHRHYLYQEYLHILAVHQPAVFILENVKGILSSTLSSGNIAENIFNDLKKPYQTVQAMNKKTKGKGYRLFSMVRKPRSFDDSGDPMFRLGDYTVRCERYGIPQARHRVIVLGIRDDIDLQPRLLEEQDNQITVQQRIGDLPKVRSGLSKGFDSAKNWRRTIMQLKDDNILSNPNISEIVKQEILNQLDNLPENLERGAESIDKCSSDKTRNKHRTITDRNQESVFNHSTRSHIPADLHRYFFGACFASVNHFSPKLSDFPKNLLPKHRNINEGVNGTQFADRFRVQITGKPSTTITSHISKDGHYYIHPDPSQCRSLTVREAARLQTFPDDYYFMGPRTSQYQQVGNAVPPLLACQLAEIVYKLFQDYRVEKPETTDKISAEHRSWNMSRIRSINTRPELTVRSTLHQMGYRFRLHQKDLPGNPDIVLKKYKTVIFVHGCFWHRHPSCKYVYTPKSRVQFWKSKFQRNVARDQEVKDELHKLGWNIVTIWECETKNRGELRKILEASLPSRDPLKCIWEL